MGGAGNTLKNMHITDRVEVAITGHLVIAHMNLNEKRLMRKFKSYLKTLIILEDFKYISH